MSATSVARASVTIDAPIGKVWDALVDPASITRYMAVTRVVSEWREGSPIVWHGQLGPKSYEVSGTILRLEAPRLFEYRYVDPLTRSAHRVRIELAEERALTRVSLSEDSHAKPRAFEHAEGGWRLVLHNLKASLESP